MSEKDGTARVTMLWPEDLKTAVRERVGARGLTEFTLAAVRAKLGIHDAHKADTKELNEVKFLAQQLADAIATGGDYEDRKATLQLMNLPDWIDTTGWPEDCVDLVKVEDSSPEPVNTTEPEVSEQVLEPTLDREGGVTNLLDHFGGRKEEPPLPAVGDPGTVRSSEEPKAAISLLERIQAKAAEKGVDISGVELKPASGIERPAERPIPEPEPEPIPEPTPEPVSSDACPNCGSTLVGGECWECM